MGAMCGTCAAVLFANAFLSFGTCLSFQSPAWFAWTGVTQFVYIAPLCWYVWRRRAYDVLVGVAVGALLTFMVSARCGFRITYPGF